MGHDIDAAAVVYGHPLESMYSTRTLLVSFSEAVYTDSGGYILVEGLRLDALSGDFPLEQCWTLGSCDSCLDPPVNNSISCGWCPYVNNPPSCFPSTI